MSSEPIPSAADPGGGGPRPSQHLQHPRKSRHRDLQRSRTCGAGSSAARAARRVGDVSPSRTGDAPEAGPPSSTSSSGPTIIANLPEIGPERERRLRRWPSDGIGYDALARRAAPARRRGLDDGSIMQGCDNFCAYCVVPWLGAGSEPHRPGRSFRSPRSRRTRS